VPLPLSAAQARHRPAAGLLAAVGPTPEACVVLEVPAVPVRPADEPWWAGAGAPIVSCMTFWTGSGRAPT
jgi:hypothetical protein